MKLNRCLALLALVIATSAHAQLTPMQRKVVDGARHQIGVTLNYDGAYQRIAYPGGDVPPSTGVCSDVVIRALRHAGHDLQVLVHEDMKRSFAQYPPRWGLRHPDRNIDHRRVPNLATYFMRRGVSLKVSDAPRNYLPGDIVTWELPGGLPHIGIVDQRSPGARPWVIHNIGRGTVSEDVLFAYRITGHFRFPASQ